MKIGTSTELKDVNKKIIKMGDNLKYFVINGQGKTKVTYSDGSFRIRIFREILPLTKHNINLFQITK